MTNDIGLEAMDGGCGDDNDGNGSGVMADDGGCSSDGVGLATAPGMGLAAVAVGAVLTPRACCCGGVGGAALGTAAAALADEVEAAEVAVALAVGAVGVVGGSEGLRNSADWELSFLECSAESFPFFFFLRKLRLGIQDDREGVCSGKEKGGGGLNWGGEWVGGEAGRRGQGQEEAVVDGGRRRRRRRGAGVATDLVAASSESFVRGFFDGGGGLDLNGGDG